jgi:deoxyribose-phosphate aldolase
VRPDPTDRHNPSVAVCVYPNLVPVAVERLRGSGVKVARVHVIPVGAVPLEGSSMKCAMVEQGADEVTCIIDRAPSCQRYAKVYDEIVRVKEVGDVHLVILETRARHVRQRSPREPLAMAPYGDSSRRPPASCRVRRRCRSHS